MKKVISVIAIVVGSLVLLSVVAPMLLAVILKAQPSSYVGIIGGADGPTAIMVVGTTVEGSVIAEVVIGILLIVGGIWGLKKSKK